MAYYAVADLHGCYNLYEKIMNILQPNDIVYCLGDSGDRGYDSWHTLKDCLNNPQFIYLMGNHDKMLIDAIAEYLKEEAIVNNYDLQLLMSNGGMDTFLDWVELYETNKGLALSYYNRLKNLPIVKEIVNNKNCHIELSHAGHTYNEPYSDDDYLWNRTHFFNTWDNDNYQNYYCIHGHTPIEFCINKLQFCHSELEYNPDEPTAFIYCDGHKIDIDNGSFYSGFTVLFNLDDFTYTPIYDDNIEEIRKNWE